MDPPVERSKRINSAPRGPSWWRSIADEQESTSFVIQFSGGKDSVAAALALKEAGYDLHPFAMTVPGLRFREETLAYYERAIFEGRHIIRVMPPVFLSHLMAGHHQPPHRLGLCEALSFRYEDTDVQAMVIEERGLKPLTWTALGIRVADNIMRRRLVTLNGPQSVRKGQFYPVWDWKIADVEAAVKRHGVKLAQDYQLWEHNMAAADAVFWAKLAQVYPDDWATYRRWFPLAEAELFRQGMRDADTTPKGAGAADGRSPGAQPHHRRAAQAQAAAAVPGRAGR